MSKRGFIFNSVRLKKPKRNPFNLSYENKMSIDMGKLYPFMCLDVLPHDTIKVGQEYIMRAQPLIAPLMHRVDVYQHYFFVPLRLIWDDFEKFITGGEDGNQTATHPYITPNQIYGRPDSPVGTLFDYLGYPVQNISEGSPDTTTKMSSLRIRAYNFIWNEFYRDQNCQQKVANETGSIHDTSSTQNFNILSRAWKKDYFTSALPFQQRGPQVNIPYTGGEVVLSSVSNDDKALMKRWNAQTGRWEQYATGYQPLVSGGTNGSNAGLKVQDSSTSYTDAVYDPNGSLRVSDLQFPINELRRANALQRWFERNARAGSRYVEQILSHFGIHPSDYRLQRPLYLGGGKQPFSISEVVQTSESNSTSPQGNLAGKGYAHNSQYVFKHTFEEHGIIIGLLSVLPRGSYQQGLSRMLTKMDKFDYAFPEFGNLGEQEVLNQELYFDPTSGDTHQGPNKQVFGYQSRYAEYKYNHDEVHGDFRTSLNFWHMGRIFQNRPLLNSSFIQCDPDYRVFAVQSGVNHLLFDIYNNIECLRCLPAYGTPAL